MRKHRLLLFLNFLKFLLKHDHMRLEDYMGLKIQNAIPPAVSIRFQPNFMGTLASIGKCLLVLFMTMMW